MLICECDFSGFIRYRILPNEKAVSVRTAILSLFMEWIPSQRIKTDSGTDFIAREATELLKIFGILHATMNPMNSRGNAIAQNCMMQIKNEIRIIQPNADASDLEKVMDLAFLTINSRYKRNAKYTPFEMVYEKTSLGPASPKHKRM